MLKIVFEVAVAIQLAYVLGVTIAVLWFYLERWKQATRKQRFLATHILMVGTSYFLILTYVSMVLLEFFPYWEWKLLLVLMGCASGDYGLYQIVKFRIQREDQLAVGNGLWRGEQR